MWSFSFLLIFFSISGIPPLSGFLAKVLILMELIYNDYVLIGILLIIRKV
jgi:NADH:ubiquinone oxidoreductase subunit 2 (subunit N)